MLFYSVATIAWASITLATLPPDYVETTDNNDGLKIERSSRNQLHQPIQILQPYTFEKESSLVASVAADSSVSPRTEAFDFSTLSESADKLVSEESNQSHDDAWSDELSLQNAGNFGRRVRVSSGSETGLKDTKWRLSEVRSGIERNNVPRKQHSERNPNVGFILAKRDRNERRLNQYLYSQQFFAPRSSTRISVPDEAPRGSAESSTTPASSHATHRNPRVSTTPADPSSGNPINEVPAKYDYNNTIGADKLADVESGRYFVNGVINTKLEVTSPRVVNYEEDNPRTIIGRRQQADSETVTTKTTGSLSRPIVVAEITRYNSSTHDTSPKCTDNNATSSTSGTKCPDDVRTVSSGPRVKGHLTTSSLILNPIQAGVSLVNEEEIYLPSDNSVRSLTSIEDEVGADFDRASASGQTDGKDLSSETVATTDEESHEQRNNANDLAASFDFDHEIEIQRSVEVYHSAPVQEIHYPAEVKPIKLASDQPDLGFARQSELRGISPELPRNDQPVCNDQQVANVARQMHEIVRDGGRSPLIGDQSQTNVQGEYSTCRNLYDLRYGLATNQRANFAGVPVPSVQQQADHSSIIRQQDNLQTIRSDTDHNQYGFRMNQGLSSSPLSYVLKASKEGIAPIIQSGTKLTGKLVDRTNEKYLSAAKLQSDLNEIGKSIEKEVGASESLLTEPTQLAGNSASAFVVDKNDNKVSELLPLRSSQSSPPEVEKLVVQKIRMAEPYPVPIRIPVDRVIEKIVEVPHPFVIEKVIHNNIPYPVEIATIVERKIPVAYPQPYPVEKNVRVPQPYSNDNGEGKMLVPQTYSAPFGAAIEKNGSQLSGYLGKVTERKVPQLIPVHVGSLQRRPVDGSIGKQGPYSVETLPENTVPIDKIVEANLRVPKFYPADIGPLVGRKVPYLVPKIRNYYPAYQAAQLPLYNVPLIGNQPVNIHAVPQFQNYVYGKQPINVDGRGNIDVNKRKRPFGQSSSQQQPTNQGFSKKLRPQFSSASSAPADGSGSAGYRRHRTRGSPKNDSKIKDVSSSSNLQDQFHPGTQWKTSLYSTAVTRPSMTPDTFGGSSSQPNAHFQTATGSFRQSKMEYGFKPPMVPSVQYNEDTGTKVEN